MSDKIERCPFCKEPTIATDDQDGDAYSNINYVECHCCQYRSATKSTTERAISAHNAVARAVRERVGCDAGCDVKDALSALVDWLDDGCHTQHDARCERVDYAVPKQCTCGLDAVLSAARKATK